MTNLVCMMQPCDPEHALSVLGGVLYGTSYTNNQALRALWGNCPVSRYHWDNTVPILHKVVVGLAEESMLAWRDIEAVNKKISAASDCGWNQPRNSSMGCVTLVGQRTEKVLSISPLINRTKSQNFEHHAKSMEGEGTKIIINNLFSRAGEPLELINFLHDGDSSSFKAVKQVHRLCKDQRCINHYMKGWAAAASKDIGKETVVHCRVERSPRMF